jgi:hypothetical protein
VADGVEHRDRLAGAIYGQVVSTSTVAALALDEGLTAVHLLVGVVGTMLTFWLAHAYAALIADRVSRTAPLRLRDVGIHLRDEWPVAQAAAPPVLALSLAAAGVWSRDAGVTIALSLGVVALAGWGAFVGRRAGYSWPVTAGLAAFSGGLGLAIIALKISLH